MRCKAWNSPVEYPSIESKQDIEESEGDTIFKENVHEQNHPERCIVSESELPRYKRPKCVV